jgi:hypothetical protein
MQYNHMGKEADCSCSSSSFDFMWMNVFFVTHIAAIQGWAGRAGNAGCEGCAGCAADGHSISAMQRLHKRLNVGAHCRLKKLNQPRSFVTGEQAAQQTSPHARQWCRRRNRVKAKLHKLQAAASVSRAHPKSNDDDGVVASSSSEPKDVVIIACP